MKANESKALTAWRERGYNDASAKKPCAPPNGYGEEAKSAYLRGYRNGK